MKNLIQLHLCNHLGQDTRLCESHKDLTIGLDKFLNKEYWKISWTNPQGERTILIKEYINIRRGTFIIKKEQL